MHNCTSIISPWCELVALQTPTSEVPDPSNMHAGIKAQSKENWRGDDLDRPLNQIFAELQH
jgi:hypothetical protein